MAPPLKEGDHKYLQNPPCYNPPGNFCVESTNVWSQAQHLGWYDQYHLQGSDMEEAAQSHLPMQRQSGYLQVLPDLQVCHGHTAHQQVALERPGPAEHIQAARILQTRLHQLLPLRGHPGHRLTLRWHTRLGSWMS